MKKQKTNITDRSDLFDNLPDDLVLIILCKLSKTAQSPSDFFSVTLTCKRLNKLGRCPMVLKRAGAKTLGVKAKNWCESAHQFLKSCIRFGNLEACYFLGMIRFYCLDSKKGGLSLIARAGLKSHTPALYSLAIIHFNGSGDLSNPNRRDLKTGVRFSAVAASLGHLDSLRELGHCIQDGYGVPKNVDFGRRLIVQANARELAYSLRYSSDFSLKNLMPNGSSEKLLESKRYKQLLLISKLHGCYIAEHEPHPANKFLVEWFESKTLETELKLCSNSGCGRPETRANEFRRCSVCALANYCSRACQAHDWKMRHKVECSPLDLVGEIDGEDELDDVMELDRVAAIGDPIGGAM